MLKCVVAGAIAGKRRDVTGAGKVASSASSGDKLHEQHAARTVTIQHVID